MATGDLMLPNLPHGTANVHVMPNFVNNLLSMGVPMEPEIRSSRVPSLQPRIPIKAATAFFARHSE